MNRDQLVEFFTKSYKERGFFTDKVISRMLEDKTTEQLNNEYERIQQMNREEEEILENGTNIYTININLHGQGKTDEKELLEFLRVNRVFQFTERGVKYFNLYESFNNIVEKFIPKIEKAFPNASFTKINHIIGRKEISDLKVGDKVKLTFNSWHGERIEQGTVHDIKNDILYIRKYRCSLQCFKVQAGDECEIAKIKAFSKAS